MSVTTEKTSEGPENIVLGGATIRLVGDSGDGMQVAGSQVTGTSALMGNDVATFPDFPAEIRAPRGTRAGVSGFQVRFAAKDIFTPGDQVDTLIAMNVAGLVTNIGDLRSQGVLVVNTDGFGPKDLKLANCETNPLEDGSCDNFRLVKVAMSTLTLEAVKDCGLSTKFAERCKNFFALGLLYWLYSRDLEPTLRFINEKFAKKPEVIAANEKALRAGYYYGETTEAFVTNFTVPPAALEPGNYKNVTGNTALAWGLITAAKLSDKELFLGSYPITPASPVLEELAQHKNFGIKTFQAEDEISAVCSAIGAAFAGSMAITSSSGPGIALKGEALGLGMILELPMIILNVQRGGPSTGLPTKTEQSDLYQALYGRNGESPLPVIAARSPGDCFDTAQEAWRVASRLMTPVMLLSDGYIANGAEPWRIPDYDELEKINITHPEDREDGEAFLPYERDELLARPWAYPGIKGLEHRLGGLEKEDLTGNVSYDPDNHQHMTNVRQQKVDNVAKIIGNAEVTGEPNGDLLVLSWGGTYGSCLSAVTQSIEAGHKVAHCHLRWLNPFPANLGELLKSYKQVLIPELNMGQLAFVIKGTFLHEVKQLNKVEGKPFNVSEIVAEIEKLLS